MTTLKGIDVSGWQTPDDWKSLSPAFIMIKASEGVNYKSDGLDVHYNAWSGKSDGKPVNKPYGFYHYARPETGNSPTAEAESFLNYVGHHKGYALFALDVEEDALKYKGIVSWSLSFLNYVAKEMNTVPILYTNAAATRELNWTSVANKYPLWVAHYGVDTPNFGVWDKYTMWQYTNSPLDQDIFNGSIDKWYSLVENKHLTKKWVISSQTPTHIELDYE